MKGPSFVVCFCSLILYIGCSKSETHFPVDPYLINNFNYKPGTYWVYKDSLSGVEDSFFVTKNSPNSQPLTRNSSTYVDAIIIDGLQYNSSNMKVAKWSMSLGGASIGWYYKGSVTYSYKLISTPFVTGIIDTSEKDSAYVISVDGNYTINGESYSGVAKYRHFCDANNYYPRFDDTYYLNSQVGIIKMDINHDTHKIWELQRSKIVK